MASVITLDGIKHRKRKVGKRKGRKGAGGLGREGWVKDVKGSKYAVIALKGCHDDGGGCECKTFGGKRSTRFSGQACKRIGRQHWR